LQLILNNDREYIFDLIKDESAHYLYERTKSIIKGINRRLKRACNSIGIPPIQTYAARHSFSTHLIGKGASVAFLSQALGHRSISTTQAYIGSFSEKQMKSEMEKLV